MSVRVSQIITTKNWAWKVKSILAKCGLHSWWHQSSCDGLSHGEAKHVVTCCLFRLERENWKFDIVSKPKLRSYVKLKADYGETEGYVQRTRVKVHGSLLAHLRWRTAPLQIETGRYIFFPVEERTCETCNSGMVEDEEHFCVGCPGNQRPSAQVDGASSCTQDFGRCRTRKNSSE